MTTTHSVAARATSTVERCRVQGGEVVVYLLTREERWDATRLAETAAG